MPTQTYYVTYLLGAEDLFPAEAEITQFFVRFMLMIRRVGTP